MTDLHDLIESWQRYRNMLAMIRLPSDHPNHIDLSTQHYQRLVDDFALVIRRRLGR